MNTTGDSKERGRPRRRKSSKARRTVARCRQSSLCVSRTATRRRCASHRGTKLNQWNEDDMKNAIKEWRSESKNSGRTVREIARTWNVPYAAFRRRMLNTNQLHAQHCSGRPTVFTQTKENELATHIRNLAAAGFPCNRTDVKNLAYEYAVKNGINGFSEKRKNAGYYWFRGLIRRHKDFVMKKEENLSVSRAMCMNKQQITNWLMSMRML